MKMCSENKKTIVVSAVNIRKGGTLTILRGCLEHLSSLSGSYRIIALVHKRSLCDYPGIEYREMPDCIRGWGRRLWAEYVTMHRISREIAREDGRKVWLWLSMHDTTPRVEAEHQEVYCHTSFPFLKLKARDWKMDPKIPLFALFTRWAYRINVHRNDSLIVQQEWFADALSRLLGVPREKFRVIPPERPSPEARPRTEKSPIPLFFYASTPDCHKNFETLCEAARMLDTEGIPFRLVLTIKGDENRYARWLNRKYGAIEGIEFKGFMDRDTLYGYYASADCFVFPSRIETWGLPISEYAAIHPDGRMLLADLPYAHETAAGYAGAEFFPVNDACRLKELMYESIAAR